jgi:PKD repeat protein
MTANHFRLWKTLATASLALLLSACLPIPIFEVTPSVARANTELTFDASGSVVSNVPEGNVAVGWSWKFGDGKTAKGEVVKHTYEKAGNYTIELTVTDSAGRDASVTETLTVEAALETSEESETETDTETETESSSASAGT